MSRNFGSCGEITITGVIPELAPDLTFPSDRASTLTTHRKVSGIDVSGGVLQTVLSLSGKFAIDFLVIDNLTNLESVSCKLTVDGVVIWDDSYSSAPRDVFIGIGATAATALETISCQSTFLFEYATDVDASVDLLYLARPLK